MELNGEMPGHQWCSATVHFVHGWRQHHKADDAFGRRQLSRLYACAKETFLAGCSTRAIHCYDMWYMFILQKLRLQLDGRALHFDSCDHQDDMISSSFESLIESKQSVPPVSILELLCVFENCLALRAVWLARN